MMLGAARGCPILYRVMDRGQSVYANPGKGWGTEYTACFRCAEVMAPGIFPFVAMDLTPLPHGRGSD